MKPVPVSKNEVEHLLGGNPMMSETRRHVRKIAGYNLAPAAQRAALITLGVIYSFFLILVAIYHGGPIADVVLYIQTVVFCFLAPSVTHNSIVGERERRSWDMLLVAPVTPRQIVVAKYMTGVTSIGLIAGALLPVLLIGWVGSERSLLTILAGDLISISFGICLNSFALAVSARAKRSLHAQTSIFGTAAGLLLLWPILVTALTQGNMTVFLFLNLLNPFFLLAHILNGLGSQGFNPFTWLAGWQVVFYLLATLYFLRLAHGNIVKGIQQDSDSA